MKKKYMKPEITDFSLNSVGAQNPEGGCIPGQEANTCNPGLYTGDCYKGQDFYDPSICAPGGNAITCYEGGNVTFSGNCVPGVSALG